MLLDELMFGHGVAIFKSGLPVRIFGELIINLVCFLDYLLHEFDPKFRSLNSTLLDIYWSHVIMETFCLILRISQTYAFDPLRHWKVKSAIIIGVIHYQRGLLTLLQGSAQ